MKLLLAVSAGIDSMYMAKRALDGVLFPFMNKYAIAHCNFTLRGEESDGDEAFVRKWCEDNRIKSHFIRFDTIKYAKKEKISIEMAARELRYGWFADLCLKYGYDAVAVAHNADDNVETLLLNLLRGCGSRGMKGMATDSGVFPHRVLRPILHTSRSEITDYMVSKGLSWREDRTNTESLYKRNLLRHKVLPIFKDINPSFQKTIASDMAHITQVDDIAQEYYVTHREKCSNIKELLSLKHWKYILYRELELYHFSEGCYNDLCRLLLEGKTLSGKTFYSPTHKLELGSNSIDITPISGIDIKNNEIIKIDTEGIYDIAGRRFKISIEQKPDSLCAPNGVIYASLDKLYFPFYIRNWENGDWITPLGLSGKKKKISDVFVDLKIPSFLKESEVVLVREPQKKETLSLLCRKTSESVKVKNNDSKVLVIRELL